MEQPDGQSCVQASRLFWPFHPLGLEVEALRGTLEEGVGATQEVRDVEAGLRQLPDKAAAGAARTM